MRAFNFVFSALATLAVSSPLFAQTPPDSSLPFGALLQTQNATNSDTRLEATQGYVLAHASAVSVPVASVLAGVTSGSTTVLQAATASGIESVLGFTPLSPANNLSELTSTAVTARSNLGVPPVPTNATVLGWNSGAWYAPALSGSGTTVMTSSQTSFTLGDVLTPSGSGDLADLGVMNLSSTVVTMQGAQNNIYFTPSAAANTQDVIGTSGTDTNVNLRFTMQGAGAAQFQNAGATCPVNIGSVNGGSPFINTGGVACDLYVSAGTSAGANNIHFQPAGLQVLELSVASGSPTGGVQITSGAGQAKIGVIDGTNANSNLILAAKGTGTVQAPTNSSAIDSTAQVATDKFVQNAMAAVVPNIPAVSPICSTTMATGTTGNPGGNVYGRKVFYCPQGGSPLQLLIPSFYVSGSQVETPLTSVIMVNLSVQPNLPAPWNPATTYTSGQSVTYTPTGTSSAPTPYVYTATTSNTNSLPTPGNSNWSAGTEPARVSVTCNHSQTCIIPVTLTGAGVYQTAADVLTDPIPVAVSAGSYLGVYTWMPKTSANSQYAGTSQGFVELGDSLHVSQFGVDLTASGDTNTNTAGGFPVTAIVGVRTTPGPSACVIGTSLDDGFSEAGGGLSSFTFVSAGTGHTSAEIGHRLRMNNAGASTHAVGQVVAGAGNGGIGTGTVDNGAEFIISSVSGGAVTLTTAWNGIYSSGQGETVPNGTQGLYDLDSSTPTTLTNITITPNFGLATYDNYHQFFQRGMLARGLNDADIPTVMLARSGDTLVGFLSRAVDRLAEIQRVGCSTVIIDSGYNDLSAGTSASVVEGYITSVAQEVALIPAVKSVLVATIKPLAITTTDGFETTANMTVSANNANVQAVNAWMRTNFAGAAAPPTQTAPITGYLEISDTLSPNRDGKLIPGTGVVCQYTADGVHLTPAGYAKVETAVAAQAGKIL
jgi:lysophospholipase L1-like esterase